MNKEIKDRINKRKIAYVYLMHRMFEGSPASLLKIMKPRTDVTVEDLQDWDRDYKAAVYETIREAWEDFRLLALVKASGRKDLLAELMEASTGRGESAGMVPSTLDCQSLRDRTMDNLWKGIPLNFPRGLGD